MGIFVREDEFNELVECVWFSDHNLFLRRIIPTPLGWLSPREIMFLVLGLVPSLILLKLLWGQGVLAILSLAPLALFFFIAKMKVKTMPVERQVLMLLKVSPKVKPEHRKPPERRVKERRGELEVSLDVSKHTPLKLTPKVPYYGGEPRQLDLYIDGELRASALPYRVSKGYAYYTLLFTPEPQDLGVRVLELRFRDSLEPVERIKVRIGMEGGERLG